MRPHPTPTFEPASSHAEPESDREAATPDATGRMIAILATIAVAVLIWPVLMHPSKPAGWKPAATVAAQAKAPSTSMSVVPLLRSDKTTGAWLPTESNWGDQLFSSGFWSRQSSSSGSWNRPRSGLSRADRASVPWPEVRPVPEGWDFDDDERPEAKINNTKTFRTMCVRMCDGYYWPVSFSVTKDRFDVDADKCARSCGGADQAKLFVYRNPGSEIDDMEDLDGHAYKKLKTAFLFKTKYEASCKCRPDPWDQASLDRHKSYALAQQVQQGDKRAAAELQELRTKIRTDEQAAAVSKSAQSKSAKSASLAPSKKDAAEDADVNLSAPVATASVARTNVIRGSDRQSGNLRSARKSQAPVADADDDDEPAPAVRVRLGNRPAVDVRARPSRARKAAEAAGGRVVKQ